MIHMDLPQPMAKVITDSLYRRASRGKNTVMKKRGQTSSGSMSIRLIVNLMQRAQESAR